MSREWKILLVDDQDYTRQLLSNILMSVASEPKLVQRRYSFLQASTAAQASYAFNLYRPDLVFLDIDLPDGNGLELLHQLKESRKDCFIVMVSGVSTLENVKSAINEGAASFVVKPFNGDKIFAVMQLFDKFVEEQNALKKPS